MANSTTTMTICPSKPKMIILEGVDRTGKSSMQEAINKLTNYKHIVVDRGPIGFKTYCDLFGRPSEFFEQYVEIERALAKMDNILVIYLDCDTKILVDRCLRTNHEIIDFELHKQFYEFYFNLSPLNKIKVDTTNKHVSEIVSDLIKEGIL